MKKTSLVFYLSFLLMFIIITVTKAQQYHPFPENNATWTEHNAVYEGFPPATWTSLFKAESDTMLFDIAYTNVYEYKIDPGSFDTIRILSSSIRQDILDKKVFIVRHYLT